MTTSILEKILYGLKVANDNIIVLNEKIETLERHISYLDTDPCDFPGPANLEGDADF